MNFKKVRNIGEFGVQSIMSLCAVALIFYIANLGFMMKNASDNARFAHDMSIITSSLAESEFNYISLKQSVTLDKAREMGFVEIKNPQFVGLDQKTAVSLNRVR